MASCNTTTHLSIGMSPRDVTKLNEYDVWKKLYGGVYPPSKSCLFSEKGRECEKVEGNFHAWELQKVHKDLMKHYFRVGKILGQERQGRHTLVLGQIQFTGA